MDVVAISNRPQNPASFQQHVCRLESLMERLFSFIRDGSSNIPHDIFLPRRMDRISVREDCYNTCTTKVGVYVAKGLFRGISQSIFYFMSVHIEVILDKNKTNKNKQTYNYYLY